MTARECMEVVPSELPRHSAITTQTRSGTVYSIASHLPEWGIVDIEGSDRRFSRPTPVLLSGAAESADPSEPVLLPHTIRMGFRLRVCTLDGIPITTSIVDSIVVEPRPAQ